MRNLLAHAVAYTAAAVIQKGLGFVVFLWLAAALPVEEYAKFGLFFAFQAGIAALIGAGVVESAIGRLKDHPLEADRRRVLSAASGAFLIMAAMGLVVAAALSGPLRRWTGASSSDLALLALIGVASAFFVFQAQLVRLEEKHGASLLLNNLPMFAAFLFGLAAFLAFHTVTGIFLGMMLGLAAAFPLFIGAYSGLRRAFGEPALIVQLTAHMFPFAFIAATGWLSGYGSTYLINFFFDASEVSRFTFAYTISSVLQLVATSLNQVWSPRFYRIVHETPRDEVERLNRRFYMLEGGVLGLVGGGTLLLAPAAIALAGVRLQPYSGLSAGLFLLFAGYAVSVPWYHAQNYYFAHARGRSIMTLMLISSAAGLALWFAAIWYLGALGAYLGFAMQMLARSVLVVAQARREWQIRILWEGPAIALLLLGLGALAGEWFLRIVALG